MSFALRGEKELPDIPVDIDAGETEVGSEGFCFIPFSKNATSPNTKKALPSINVEKMLSEEEMSRLHELWNGAGLSARAHRRRRQGQNPTPRRIPAPISVPKPEDVGLNLPSADSSTASRTPTTGTRKRWGFFSARPFSETKEAEKKGPNALEMLRSMAQDRLKKRIRYAKSAPNLGDQAAPSGRRVTFQPAPPLPVDAVPKDIGGSSPRNPTSPDEPATPEAVLQPEDMDENAIYFTIDPSWRASRGSAQFQYITPIPESPISESLERPDSPLLHRHYSLDQLSFAAQQATEALTGMEFPEVYPSDEVLHPIDELHAYLELGTALSPHWHCHAEVHH